MAREIYHGWIIVTHEEGYRDRFYVEYVENGERKRALDTTSPAEAVEWWDARVGQPVKLLPTPIGGYRVYTDNLADTAKEGA